ncbi:MAG: DUF416 family protein [Gemmatimonadaceae bacterium]|nr:DUF416 family protein [Gemmatimonadaceae bacterium]
MTPDLTPETVSREASRSVELAWESVVGRSATLAEVQEQLARLASLVAPDDSSDGAERTLGAQEAVEAALHALSQAADPDPSHAVWAARGVTDAVDRRLQQDRSPGLLTADDQRDLGSNPAIRSEMVMQRDVLERLRAAAGQVEAMTAVRNEAAGRPPRRRE